MLIGRIPIQTWNYGAQQAYRMMDDTLPSC